MEQQGNAAAAAWREAVAGHQGPVLRRSVWQLVSTLSCYVAMWALMILSLKISYWLTLALAVVAAGLAVRLFIIFHDAGHGSFFASRRANDITGFITGVLTFTPYLQWRRLHALHHATSGDLDRRGPGDVWTLTVEEYNGAGRWKRLAYRTVRNPFVLFVIGPIYVFLIEYRFWWRASGERERRGVHLTNAALLGIALAMSLTVGFKAYVLIQLPVHMIAGAAGMWLFYVQHQFEDVYWERRKEWDFADAALQGSSFYKLPRILQWFSGNIGFHHVHHLSPAIPNYNLERCHNGSPIFRGVKPVTLWSGMKALTFRLWDERERKLVGFGGARAHRREAARRRGLIGERSPGKARPQVSV
jgi:omega-6 fatty acid desaturase (delta-12 desaturase)